MSETLPRRYDNFDVRIEQVGGAYRARVWSETTGEGSSPADLSVALDALDGFLFNVGQPRRRTRGTTSTRLKAAQTFGASLYDGVFKDEALACLKQSVAAAASRGVGTRIRLRLGDAPELSDLPWEFLYDRPHRDFLSLSTHTPVIRYLECPESLRPIRIEPPLRILAVIASPSDYPTLDVEREWEALEEALGELTAKGLVELERLEKPQFGALPRALRKAQFHILHFIGHGEFSESGGGLIFEDEQRRGKTISGDRLGTILRDYGSLRLVVLNACEGARASRTDAFSGTAQMLIAQGLPAVLAMQFEITDEAAITIAAEFYTSLAIGDPIDTALADARRRLFAQQDDGVEWATPVLYLRSLDGTIFDVVQTQTVVETREVARDGAPPPVVVASVPVPPTKPEVAPPRAPAPVPLMAQQAEPASRSDAGGPSAAGTKAREGGGTAGRAILVATTLVGLIALPLVFVRLASSPAPAPTSAPAPTPTPAPVPTRVLTPSKMPQSSLQNQQSPLPTQQTPPPSFDAARAMVGRWSTANGSCSGSPGTVTFDQNQLTFFWPRSSGPPNVAVETIVVTRGHMLQTRVDSDVNTTAPETDQSVVYDVQADHFTSTNRSSGHVTTHTRC